MAHYFNNLYTCNKLLYIQLQATLIIPNVTTKLQSKDKLQSTYVQYKSYMLVYEN